MEKQEKRHGGLRKGAGRKTDRKIDRRRPVYLFEDQHPLSGAEVRRIIDAHKAREGETQTDKNE